VATPLTATTVVLFLEQLSWLLGTPSGPKISVDRFFLTGDEFKYVPEKRLNGQSEVFYYTANENSEIITNSALTKAVSMLKNKDMLICLLFVQMGKAQNFLTAPRTIKQLNKILTAYD